ncbi:MAG: molybdopterin-guanine dinucleotide biosynthesis protein MobB [Deltaproteobacteria bacterium]|nr:molybdopterin-guanine dinucleotide biosynthesis protein MobB [Deltaproteobacteria bacterium]
MKIKSKFWLENDAGRVVLDEGRLKILELINELGSIPAAAEAMNMSPRRLRAQVTAMERKLKGKLVATSAGPKKTKSSRLTHKAKKLIQDFKNLDQEGLDHARELFKKIFQGSSSPGFPAVPVVVVVGPAGSGKTSLMKGLIKEWTGRGRRVAVIKRIDDSGKLPSEVRQFFKAGVKGFILSGPNGFRIEIPEEAELQPEIIAANYVSGIDLALVESRESLNLPSIEVFRLDKQKIPLTRKRKNLLVVTGDRPRGSKDWPYIKMDDLTGIVDLIEKAVIRKAEGYHQTELLVDGRRVPMLSFVEVIIANAVTGMVTSLKSCEKAENIQLTIHVPEVK